uniref:HTH psq-type domain-containing protein n=1 Tax=Amphimedon queenslandica TaxID=400682 RepID=A0A1X7UNE8_AMPQE
MTNAIKAVEEEGLKLRLAAELRGIPKSTLYDRIREMFNMELTLAQCRILQTKKRLSWLSC